MAVNDFTGEIGLRSDVIQSLRSLARKGANVRQLVAAITELLQLKEHRVIPVLSYLTSAFCLPLPTVLPIREWLGTENDEEIDAMILPAIEKARSKWEGEEQNGVAADPARASSSAPS
jgi:hypothetical protein